VIEHSTPLCGFAHTFGGLLIVGVSEKDAQPQELVGVEVSGELKTSIASSIATNVSPAPSYEIGECSLPNKPTRKLAVVRVRQDSQLHYLTKKGQQPIYVRNEDQSVPADAAQLRSLIERKAQSSELMPAIANRLEVLRRTVELYKTRLLRPTYLQILLAPISHPPLALDSAIEQQFRRLISRNFSFHYGTNEVTKEDRRGLSWYQHEWLSESHESVWRVTSAGDVGYASQIEVSGKTGAPVGGRWSLGDVLQDLFFTIAISRSLWRKSGFYGEAQLAMHVDTGGLPLHPGILTKAAPRDSWWNSEHELETALDGSILAFAEQPSRNASVTATFNSSLHIDALAEVVASLLNDLVRSLGHAGNLAELNDATQHFVRAYG